MKNKELCFRACLIKIKRFQQKLNVGSILRCLFVVFLIFGIPLIGCGGHCESDTDCPDTKICSGYESLFWDGRVCVYSDKDLVLASDFNTNCSDAIQDYGNLDTENDNNLNRQCIDRDQDGFGGTGDCDKESLLFDCNDNREDINPEANEQCDTFDNDCNGLTDALDPNMIPRLCENQTGVCKNSTTTCVEGEFQHCSDNEYRNNSELYAFFEEGNELLCDNLDNDCDGQIDEDLEENCYSGPENTNGIGMCRAGLRRCDSGGWTECINEKTPEEETCGNDGEDNNCDYILDNIVEVGNSCINENLQNCREGIFQCANDELLCIAEPVDLLESCNSHDDNCDGQIDNAVYCGATLSCGHYHCCLLINGIAHCWGNNDSGQSSPPDRIFKYITAGGSYTCGLLEGNTAKCWGIIEEAPEGEFIQLNAGNHFVCGLKSDNTVECWGTHPLEDTTESNIIAQIVVGWDSFCSLTMDGLVECTDINFGTGGRFRQLSLNIHSNNICGITHNNSLECEVDFLENNPSAGQFAQISTGSSFVCAINKDNSTVDCWGNNNPHGTLDAPSGEFIMISAGADHTCGLRQNNTVECWGDNSFGQSNPPF